MIVRIIPWLAFALLIADNAYSEDGASRPKLLVVQTFVTDGKDKNVELFAGDLTEELVVRAASLSRPHGIEVKSESELQLIAKELKNRADLRPENCSKLEECLARIFEDEADYVLRGTLGRLGDSWVVTLKLIEVKTMETVRPRSCSGENKEELIEAVERTAAEVLGYQRTQPETPALELPADGRKIGIVPITGGGADEQNAEALSEMLGVIVRELGWSAQTKGDLVSMINYATDRSELTGGPLTDAIMEIAAASGVSLLVTGSIGRVERTHLISLKLVDLESGQIIGRVLESYIGEESGLAGAMKYACYRLFGRPQAGEGGPLSIVAAADGWYRIDEGEKAALPQVVAKTGVAAGKKQLNISAPGFFPYYADIYVFENEPLRYRPALEPLPNPWYESPVFWTISSILVAASTTAILLIAMPPKSGTTEFEH